MTRHPDPLTLTLHFSTVWTKDVVREVLPNGLTLLVQPDHSAPVVSVVTHVKAGFFDEPDRWTGISHVLEHMFFKGTARRGVGDIARETKAAGGYLNAGTGYDHTSYFTVLPASGLAAALDIQSDALRNSVIDPMSWLARLQVISRRQRKRDTPLRAHQTLQRSCSTVTDPAVAIWDRRNSSPCHCPGDLWPYYRSSVRARADIVASTGSLDPDHASSWLERLRGAGGIGPWPSPRSLPGVGPARLCEAMSSRRVCSAVGGPPLHEDAPALDLALLLGGPPGSGFTGHFGRMESSPRCRLKLARQSRISHIGDLEPEHMPRAIGASRERVRLTCRASADDWCPRTAAGTLGPTAESMEERALRSRCEALVRCFPGRE